MNVGVGQNGRDELREKRENSHVLRYLLNGSETVTGHSLKENHSYVVLLQSSTRLSRHFR